MYYIDSPKNKENSLHVWPFTIYLCNSNHIYLPNVHCISHFKHYFFLEIGDGTFNIDLVLFLTQNKQFSLRLIAIIIIHKIIYKIKAL